MTPLGNATILVVDDNPELVENLKEWLECSGYDALGAGNASQAMALARQHAIDVVVSDIEMPGLSGIELLALIKDLDPAIEVVILTGHATIDNAVATLREGRAFDFLRKPLKDLDLLNFTIEKALLRRNRSRAMVVPAAQPPSNRSPAINGLSGREQEILALLVRGFENREIADTLCLSERTVRNHLSNIYEKLGVTNRTQAVILCQQSGLT